MPNVDPVNLKFYLPSKIHKNINEINGEKMALAQLYVFSVKVVVAGVGRELMKACVRENTNGTPFFHVLLKWNKR